MSLSNFSGVIARESGQSEEHTPAFAGHDGTELVAMVNP